MPPVLRSYPALFLLRRWSKPLLNHNPKESFMSLFRKTLLTSTICLAIAAFSGCAAINTEINHGSLQTSTKMSNTIFLPPFPENEQLIYVEAKNTSDQDVQIQT